MRYMCRYLMIMLTAVFLSIPLNVFADNPIYGRFETRENLVKYLEENKVLINQIDVLINKVERGIPWDVSLKENLLQAPE